MNESNCRVFLSSLCSELTSKFSTTKRIAGRKILLPTAPIGLDEALLSLVESHRDLFMVLRDDFPDIFAYAGTPEESDEDNPSTAYVRDVVKEILSEEGYERIFGDQWQLETVVIFGWGGIVSIGILDIGGGDYFLWGYQEAHIAPLELIARISKADFSHVAPTVIQRIIAKNGEGFGVQDLIWDMPEATEIHRPDILPIEQLYQAFWSWLETFSDDVYPTWVWIRDTTISRGLRTNPAVRSALPVKVNDEWIADYQERREEGRSEAEELRALTRKDKRQILAHFMINTCDIGK